MKIYLLSALVSFALSLLFCWGLIPLLRCFKAGQNILVYVKEHKGKSGTPTMGGLAFIAAAIFAAARTEGKGISNPKYTASGLQLKASIMFSLVRYPFAPG